nr:unnamed protein product [Callosobruchus analis]
MDKPKKEYTNFATIPNAAPVPQTSTRTICNICPTKKRTYAGRQSVWNTAPRFVQSANIDLNIKSHVKISLRKDFDESFDLLGFPGHSEVLLELSEGHIDLHSGQIQFRGETFQHSHAERTLDLPQVLTNHLLAKSLAGNQESCHTWDYSNMWYHVMDIMDTINNLKNTKSWDPYGIRVKILMTTSNLIIKPLLNLKSKQVMRRVVMPVHNGCNADRTNCSPGDRLPPLQTVIMREARMGFSRLQTRAKASIGIFDAMES